MQRDEIQQAEIAKLQRELAQRDRQAKEAHDHLVLAVGQLGLLRGEAQRKALTTEIVMKQRDEALLELAAMRSDRNLLREQIAGKDAAIDQLRNDFGRTRSRLISDRDHAVGQMEKAQADYRDLRLRMLEVDTGL